MNADIRRAIGTAIAAAAGALLIAGSASAAVQLEQRIEARDLVCDFYNVDDWATAEASFALREPRRHADGDREHSQRPGNRASHTQPRGRQARPAPLRRRDRRALRGGPTRQRGGDDPARLRGLEAKARP